MNRSREIQTRARELIPGGVNSPVRAYAAVGGDPPVIASGRGSRIRDVDGNEYVDCVGSWGPLVLGHAHPDVIAAVVDAAAAGTSFGAPTARELELAELIVESVPSVEKVRLVNSGTEAAMSAVRLARAATGRDRIVKFVGCYHGHADAFLVKAGSGAATLGQPSSPGVPRGVTADTLTAPYNDLDAVRALFAQFPGEIACVIVEPVAANMGLVLPAPGFLEGLRQITSEAGSLLIFDEVITGFRVALGGAQEWCGVMPDLTVLGKIIGGGLPVGAFGGRGELMDLMAPAGSVYQAGTLSGNPLAVAAGIATLRELRRANPYAELAARGERLCQALAQAAAAAGIAATVTGLGSMGCIFFREPPVRDFADAAESDTTRYARFHGHMLRSGVYLAPSQFETLFLSAAHTNEDVDIIIRAARAAFAQL